MARTEQKLHCCMITQALHPDYWKWTDPKEVKALVDGDIVKVTEIVKKKLEDAGCKIEECYSVNHDKDVREVWDDKVMGMVQDYKTHHIHIVIKLSGAGLELTKIADAVGVEPQYVEKAGKGRYAFDNMLSYLIHIKYPDKHQYDPTEVYNCIGRPYIEIYHERLKDWEKGRAKVQANQSRCDIDWLVDKILKGELSMSQITLTDEFYRIYAANKRRCKDALEAYAERKTYKAIQMLENGEFKLSVFFFYGMAGVGKSTGAEALIKRLMSDAYNLFKEKWTVYRGATSNPLDDYSGEEIIYLDDLRGTAMTASDWLLLLDPYHASPASARYKNKPPVASRVVIITSTIDPYTYFYYTKNKGAVNEAMDQFIRRIEACVEVYVMDNNGHVITDPKELEKVTNTDGSIKSDCAERFYAVQASRHGKPQTHMIQDDSVKNSPYAVEPLVTTRYNFETISVCNSEDMLNTASDLVVRNHTQLMANHILSITEGEKNG